MISSPFFPQEDASAGSSIKVPPPTWFRPPTGEVKSAYATSARLAIGANTPARQQGLRYEAKVHSYVAGECGPSYRKAPRIAYHDNSGRRECEPDGLIEKGAAIFIVEIKIRHMPDAWWQLRKLYTPVVQKLYPGKFIIPLEICSSYDPAVPFPEDHSVFIRLDEALANTLKSDFRVLQWKS